MCHWDCIVITMQSGAHVDASTVVQVTQGSCVFSHSSPVVDESYMEESHH